MAAVGRQNFRGPTHQIAGIGAVITSSSIANPSNILFSSPHGLHSGESMTISGHITAVPDINAAHIVTVVDDLNVTIPVNVTTGGTGGFGGLTGGFAGGDDDVVLEISDAQRFNQFSLLSGAGAMDVDTLLDDTNVAVAIAMEDKHSVAPATRVVVTAALLWYTFEGNFKTVRVIQNGATPATGAVLICGQKGRTR